MNDFLLGIALVTAAILLTVPEKKPEPVKPAQVAAPREEESAAPEAASFL